MDIAFAYCMGKEKGTKHLIIGNIIGEYHILIDFIRPAMLAFISTLLNNCIQH